MAKQQKDEVLVNKDKDTSLDDAREMLMAEQEARVKRCEKKLQDLLTKEKCTLVPTYTLTPDGVIPRIDVRPVM